MNSHYLITQLETQDSSVNTVSPTTKELESGFQPEQEMYFFTASFRQAMGPTHCSIQ
jgi:hypothetical protein